MSNSYKNGAFALGLVVGGGLALNLFLWLDYRTNNEIAANSGTNQNSQNSQVGQYWDGLIGMFISPNGDTLAQWVMAFFTILATIVLILTLRSANKTNLAAINASNAALEANQIMRDEQRPWVTIERDVNCQFFDVGDHGGRLCWNHNLVNKGKSPAYNIKVHTKLFRSENFADCLSEIETFTSQCQATKTAGNTAILFADETTKFMRFQNYFSGTYEIGRNSNGELAKIPKTGDEYSALVCVTYRTGVSIESSVGVETSAYKIEIDKNLIGPWQHKMLEFASYRIVR